MDIICPICREPWENDTFHDYAEEFNTSYNALYKVFRTKGCGVAFDEWSISSCQPTSGHEARSVLADLLGDDVDGYASLVEDMNL